MIDICCVCKKEIAPFTARYGLSEEPCHWDCRHGVVHKKSTIAGDAAQAIEKGDAALAALKAHLKQR